MLAITIPTAPKSLMRKSSMFILSLQPSSIWRRLSWTYGLQRWTGRPAARSTGNVAPAQRTAAQMIVDWTGRLRDWTVGLTPPLWPLPKHEGCDRLRPMKQFSANAEDRFFVRQPASASERQGSLSPLARHVDGAARRCRDQACRGQAFRDGDENPLPRRPSRRPVRDHDRVLCAHTPACRERPRRYFRGVLPQPQAAGLVRRRLRSVAAARQRHRLQRRPSLAAVSRTASRHGSWPPSPAPRC